MTPEDQLPPSPDAGGELPQEEHDNLLSLLNDANEEHAEDVD